MTNHYDGAPEECGYCHIWAERIQKLGEDGACPINHTAFGPRVTLRRWCRMTRQRATVRRTANGWVVVLVNGIVTRPAPSWREAFTLAYHHTRLYRREARS